ncbi:MAG: serine hydrolase [Candidatus Paceibacterota bacterium]
MIKNFLIRNHHVRWGIIGLIFLAIVFIFCFATWAMAEITYYTLWRGHSVVYRSADLVPDRDLGQTISSYLLNKPADNLPLSAGAYLVSDLNSKEIIVGRNENQVSPIASVTKLVTAIIAEDLIKPDQQIVVTKEAWQTYGDTGQLVVGEKMPLKMMLYPLLLTSSNDAAEAIAISYGREKFLAKMNEFVKKIGMDHTNFSDPSGLSPDNLSTPADLSKLAVYLYQKKPKLLAITRETSYRYGRHTWSNYNNVALMKYYIGGKNGYTTEANRTLVSLFEVPISSSSSANSKVVEKKKRLLAVVLLQSDDKKKDAKSLINYLASYASYNGGKNGFVQTSPLEIKSL